LLYIIGAVLQVFSFGHLWLFDLGRFINGTGVGAGTLVSPIYISEISPAAQRGMLMSGYQVFVQTGALIGFWIAFVFQGALPDTSTLQWQIPAALQLVFGTLLLAASLFIPESPRYLAERGHLSAMEESLVWLRQRNSGDPELRSEVNDTEDVVYLSEKLSSHSFLDELSKKDVRRRLTVGIGLMIAQNMVGLNAINYYAPVIFMSAGFTSTSASLFLGGVFGIVKLVASLAFMLKFVSVKGNRFWLMLGSGVCGASMLVLAYSVRTTTGQTATDSISLTGCLSVLMVYTFTFFFTVSLGPISWNVCAEIFPLHINSTCCMITTCAQWAFQIVVAAMAPPLLASIGWATYLVFGGFCFASLLWVGFFVPETRGLGVGKPMDELFGAEHVADDEEAILEVTETTALLVHDRRRRSSLAAYV
jgi:sugar porter (SP) family MFS transporter